MLKGELLSTGKSKQIYATDDPAYAIVCFLDEATAFHGLKRGRIVGKGEVNNTICGAIFTLLEQQGVHTHFIRKLDQCSSLIRRCQMLPIEVKIRNRVAGSLGERVGLPLGTVLHEPVIEFLLKNERLDNPMINASHIQALQLATQQEMHDITDTALRINRILINRMQKIGIELIDFQLEFGRTAEGEIIVADDISPDSARFWDARTHEPLDIDRFRRDLGNTEQGYHELLQRMMGLECNEGAGLSVREENT